MARPRLTGSYADPNAEPEITVKPPAGLKGETRNLWIRCYIAQTSMGVSPTKARREANTRAAHSAKFIEGERDPKNQLEIPRRPKGKPGRWRGA